MDLMKCGNHIVMVVAVFVIAHGGHVHDLRYHVGSDDWPFRTFFACFVSGKRPRGGFKDRQCFSRVASGHTHEFRQRLRR